MEGYIQGLSGDDGDMSASMNTRKRVWDQVEDSEYEEDKRVLGLPIARSKCFGCRYENQENSAPIEENKLARLDNYIRNNLTTTDFHSLFIEAARIYKLEIMIPANNNREHGEEELPEWSAASMKEHYLNHTMDAEVKLFAMQRKYAKISRNLERKCIKRRDEEGNMKYDKDALTQMINVDRMSLHLMKQDVKKMNTFSNGKKIVIKPKETIQRHQKNVLDFFAPVSKQDTLGLNAFE